MATSSPALPNHGLPGVASGFRRSITLLRLELLELHGDRANGRQVAVGLRRILVAGNALVELYGLGLAVVAQGDARAGELG
jgi:hypothetical protein